jgi:histidinol-phosphate aminotransferase
MTINYKALARSGVRELAPYQPGKPIEELRRELGLERIIKLASNENPLGASPAVNEALHRLWKDIARYPDGSGFSLKQTLSSMLDVGSDCITLGNGSNDVLEMLARAYINEGDEVIFSQHAFAVYPIVTQAVGGHAVVVPARDFGHDLQAMAKAVTAKTRIIFIANPNNPTGTYVSNADLTQFLDQVPAQVIVVLDEAYFEYVSAEDYPNGLDLMAKFPNLVVSRTFSKVYGLASLRVGYAIANPEITDILNRVRQPFNVNTFALVAAEAALGDQDFVRRSYQVNLEGLELMQQGLKKLGIDPIPSVCNFVTFQHPQAKQLNTMLLAKGIIIRDVANYDIAHGLRVSIGLPQENRLFLRALDDSLEQL